MLSLQDLTWSLILHANFATQSIAKPLLLKAIAVFYSNMHRIDGIRGENPPLKIVVKALIQD